MGEVLFALVGTIVGFVLSEVATLLRARRDDKRVAASVRIMLGLEIGSNLGMVNDLWSRIEQPVPGDRSPQAQKLVQARRLVQLPVPSFSNDAYRSQLGLLPKAANAAEIARVVEIYDRLKRIEALRGEMQVLAREQEDELRAATKQEAGFSGPSRLLSYFPSSPFDDRSPDLLEECTGLIMGLLEGGNPLRPRTGYTIPGEKMPASVGHIYP